MRFIRRTEIRVPALFQTLGNPYLGPNVILSPDRYILGYFCQIATVGEGRCLPS